MLAGPAVLKPRRVCLEVAADEAAGDALAQRARIARALRALERDIVLAPRVCRGFPTATVPRLGGLPRVLELDA